MKEIIHAVKISTGALLILTFLFSIAEPSLGRAIEDQHTVSLSILSEISFVATAADVNMNNGTSGGTGILGVTGGTAYGSTSVRVYTNDSSGYNMTIVSSSTAGMVGNSQGGTIPSLSLAGGIIPLFTFTSGSTGGAFGYTVNASTTADLATAFKDDGANCNTGAADNISACWGTPSTTPKQIINRTTATALSGGTTTIVYKVIVPGNPTPALPEDTYVSTTTLTAVTN